MRVAGWSGVPPGVAALPEEHRYNIHVAEDQTASFARFRPRAPPPGEAPRREVSNPRPSTLDPRILFSNPQPL